MSGHSARLARLETGNGRTYHIVPVYDGMTKEEAYALRYGGAEPPRGVVCIVLYGTPDTPAGVPFDWAERRDDPAYPAWWDACRAASPEPIRGRLHD